MKKSTLAGFALVSLSALLPFAAEAAPVTLNFDGAFTSVANLGIVDAGIVPGGSFSASLTYDPSLTVNGGTGGTFGNGGNNGGYVGPVISLSATTPVGVCSTIVCSPGTAVFTRVLVFDNFLFNGNTFDAVQFSIFNNQNTLWQFTFGFSSTSAINGPTGPTATTLGNLMPADFTVLGGQGFFRICDAAMGQFGPACSTASDATDIQGSTNVPEPATLGLLGLGLAGLGYARRRRAA